MQIVVVGCEINFMGFLNEHFKKKMGYFIIYHIALPLVKIFHEMFVVCVCVYKMNCKTGEEVISNNMVN